MLFPSDIPMTGPGPLSYAQVLRAGVAVAGVLEGTLTDAPLRRVTVMGIPTRVGARGGVVCLQATLQGLPYKGVLVGISGGDYPPRRLQPHQRNCIPPQPAIP